MRVCIENPDCPAGLNEVEYVEEQISYFPLLEPKGFRLQIHLFIKMQFCLKIHQPVITS